MYLLAFILTIVAYYALTAPVDIVLKLTLYKAMGGMEMLTKPPVLLQVVSLFISFLERSFVMPIYAISLLLFYNDQRTRQEGYDIELLMAQAGWSTLPPAPAVESAPSLETPHPDSPAEPVPTPIPAPAEAVSFVDAHSPEPPASAAVTIDAPASPHPEPPLPEVNGA